ncbi:hypothetical protein ACQEUU_37590 [Nonomuraea sp. CA-218870]|uniref:hypothetical protein n=1 Tax=Nonomuraea sp. CA-218870 TaxID=3239998 RepID=UPI003D8F9C8B
MSKTNVHFLNAVAENGLTVPRRPDCKPWCVQHCRVDDDTTFCMGPDIPTPGTANRYVGINYCPDEHRPAYVGTTIDLGDGLDSVKVEDAEALALAILAQTARARSEAVASAKQAAGCPSWCEAPHDETEPHWGRAHDLLVAVGDTLAIEEVRESLIQVGIDQREIGAPACIAVMTPHNTLWLSPVEARRLAALVLQLDQTMTDAGGQTS